MCVQQLKIFLTPSQERKAANCRDHMDQAGIKIVRVAGFQRSMLGAMNDLAALY